MSICCVPDKSFLAHLAGKAGLVAAILLVLAACAKSPVPAPSADVIVSAGPDVSEQPRWWYMRFLFERASDGGVKSYLDTLVADQILLPLIEKHHTGIELWRFHRRWAGDATGHQFSFIFFAPTPLAEVLATQIEQDPLLHRLATDGHLREFRAQAADPERATDRAATSDASWPPEIQYEWPNFIMGASRMWQGLVHSEAERYAGLDLYPRYQAVEAGLDELWFSEGNHAFFHHLSALFGYKPMRVTRQDVMTF